MQHWTYHSGRCLLTTGRLLQDSGFGYGFGQGLRYRREVWDPQVGPKASVHFSHLPQDPRSPNPLWDRPYQKDYVDHRRPPSPPGRHRLPQLHLVARYSLFDSVVLVGPRAHRRFLFGPLSQFVPPACVVCVSPGQVSAACHGRRRPWLRSVEHGTPPSDCGSQTTPPSCNGILHTLLCSRT